MNVLGGPSRARVATATLSLVAVLALSGCGDKDEDQLSAGGGSTAPTAPDTTATAPNATPSVTTPPDPSQEPTADPDSPDDVTGAAACLPGTWVLDNTAYAQWVGLGDGDVTGTIKGTLTMTYRDDGTVDTSYDTWSVSSGTDSLGMTITLTRDGTDHGTYTVGADGSVSLTDTEIDSKSLQLTEYPDGEERNTEELKSQFSLTPFVCSGDELTPIGGEIPWSLHRES